MKILLKSRLIYYSAVVTTGQTCIKTLPDQLQSENNFIFRKTTNSIKADDDKTDQKNEKGTLGISELLDTINTTITVVNATAEILREYITPMQMHADACKKSMGKELDIREHLDAINRAITVVDATAEILREYIDTHALTDPTGTRQPNSIPPTDRQNSYNGEKLNYATVKTIPKKQVKTQNVKPTAPRATTQPVELVSKDLKEWAAHVHRYIPNLAEWKLIEILTAIENRINIVVNARKEDGDRILTDEQKEKLRELKFSLRQQNAPSSKVAQLYKRTYDAIKAFQTIDQEEILNTAENIKKKLTETTVKDTNNLVDSLKIKLKNYKKTANHR